MIVLLWLTGSNSCHSFYKPALKTYKPQAQVYQSNGGGRSVRLLATLHSHTESRVLGQPSQWFGFVSCVEIAASEKCNQIHVGCECEGTLPFSCLLNFPGLSCLPGMLVGRKLRWTFAPAILSLPSWGNETRAIES